VRVIGPGLVALELVLTGLVVVEYGVIGVGGGCGGGGGGGARSVHGDDVVLELPCFLRDRR